MAPASPAAGPPLRRPRAVAGPQGPWHTVHDDLAATGVVLVYGRLAQWLPHIQDVALVRPVLGRDWHRYQTLTHPRAKERFLASRLLLRYAAALAIETAPDLVDLAYQPGGRPFVRGLRPDRHQPQPHRGGDGGGHHPPRAGSAWTWNWRPPDGRHRLGGQGCTRFERQRPGDRGRAVATTRWCGCGR